jgi:chromosome segregation ATPase
LIAPAFRLTQSDIRLELFPCRDRAIEELKAFRSSQIKNENETNESFKLKISELNGQMNYLKSNYQQHIDHFKVLLQKFDKEKLHLIDELKAKHNDELASLNIELVNTKHAASLENQNLKASYENEITRLNELTNSLKSKLVGTQETFNDELVTLKLHYETELNSIRNNENLNEHYLSEINSLKSLNEKLKTENGTLVLDLNQYLAEISNLNAQIHSLHADLQSMKTSDTNLIDQNNILNARLAEMVAKYSDSSNDNQSFKERFDFLNRQLIEKTSKY